MSTPQSFLSPSPGDTTPSIEDDFLDVLMDAFPDPEEAPTRSEDDLRREMEEGLAEALPGRKGALHVSMEGTEDVIEYARSVAGVVSAPAFREWLIGVLKDAHSSRVDLRTVKDVARYLEVGR